MFESPPRWSNQTTLPALQVWLTILGSYLERQSRTRRNIYSLSLQPSIMVSWKTSLTTSTFMSSVQQKQVLCLTYFVLLHALDWSFLIFCPGSRHQITSLCPALGHRYALIIPGLCDPSLQDPRGKQLPGMGFAEMWLCLLYFLVVNLVKLLENFQC